MQVYINCLISFLIKGRIEAKTGPNSNRKIRSDSKMVLNFNIAEFLLEHYLIKPIAKPTTDSQERFQQCREIEKIKWS